MLKWYNNFMDHITLRVFTGLQALVPVRAAWKATMLIFFWRYYL